MRQLPLGIQLGLFHRFETFQVAAGNSQAFAAIRRLAESESPGPVWLFGPPGSGRTHLLQACCAQAGSGAGGAAYLPLDSMRAGDPALLDGYEALPLVALDEVDAIAGDVSWERALFLLFNGIAERRGRLACAASRPPTLAGLRMPDLASRLAASETHRLLPLAEAEQAEALRRRAGQRGLELPEETAAFLTRRAPRDFATLCRMLDALDTESLAAQRRLTVPFVRDWLARG